jgi:6-phosphogluconolactonase
MSAALLHVYPERSACVQALAAVIAQRLQLALSQTARTRLLLPGGSSPETLLPLLAAQALDWSRVDLSPTDERWVPADSPQSNVRLLRTGLPQAQCLDPRLAESPAEAALIWGQQLAGWPPLAAVLLGIGEDGHFASLFPGMPGLAAGLALDAAPGALVGTAPSAPQIRLSLNLPLLLASDWVGLLVFGVSKKRLIEAVLRDDPASHALPLHALLHNGRCPVQIYWAP